MIPDDSSKKRKHSGYGEHTLDSGSKKSKSSKHGLYTDHVRVEKKDLNGGPWGGASSHHPSTHASDAAKAQRQQTDPSGTTTALQPSLATPAASSLPPLPPIADPILAQTPFHHRGIQAKSSSTGTSTNHESYERLEFLGDAYIELIASRLVFSTFPTHPSGKLAQARESLVKNATLARFSRAYGFDKRAELPRAFYNAEDPKSRVSGKAWEKMLGDIFEAYCAGVVLDHPQDPTAGYAKLEAWLVALWQPLLVPQRQDPNRSDPETSWPPLDLSAKQNLNQTIAGTSSKTWFRDLSAPDRVTLKTQGQEIYHIGCFFTGWGWTEQFLGEGKGFSKKDAGMRAAKEALDNVVTGQIEIVKREFDARVRKEREMRKEAKEVGDAEGIGQKVGQSRQEE